MKKIDTIDKALEHFERKFRKVWKPTEKDLEAYNTILEYKNINEAINMTSNENYAKLYIEKLILLSSSGMYSGERALQVIDEILSKTVYEWCLILQKEIPMMRFNQVGVVEYPLKEKDALNLSKTTERNKNIIKDYDNELIEALNYEISEEDIIKFVKSQITRTINKFEKTI